LFEYFETKMNLKKKYTNKYFSKKAILVGVVLFYSVGVGFNVLAENTTIVPSNTSTSNNEAKDKLEELEKKAKIYQQIIEIKQKQGATLNNQMEMIDSNLDQVKSQIQSSESQISNFNDQIIQIQKQIESKNESILAQRVILSDLMQLYFESANQDSTVFFLNQDSIAANISSKDKFSQLGDKVKEISQSLSKMKKDLVDQTAELEKKKVTVIDLNQDLQSQNSDLQDVMTQKQSLLSQTKGEEQQYQKLLARVEEQKQELLDIDQFYATSGASIDNYPKPDGSLFASTSWYYSQRDPKWGDMTIGNTRTLMKSYGCAVTAIAMISKFRSGTETPGTLSKKPIFSGDLISWPSSLSNPRMSLVSSIAHSGVNWSTVDANLAKKNPVIVYIKKTSGKGGHYVVIHNKDKKTGKYVVHDPYFGPNLFLDTSRALVGLMGQNSGTVLDQMIIYQ
jgi:peptidoglycan hydrolase CwlO-like protein